MSPVPSLVNIVLVAAVAGLGAAYFLGSASPPSPEEIAALRSDAGHGHKGDRLPLFQASGASITVSTPNSRAFGAGELNVDRAAGTTVAQKNVFVVSWPAEMPAGPGIEVRDPLRRAQPVSIEASTRSREWNRGRVAYR